MSYHPKANGMKDSIDPPKQNWWAESISCEKWNEELPASLGLRGVYKPDLRTPPNEPVLGAPLKLPRSFSIPAQEEW